MNKLPEWPRGIFVTGTDTGVGKTLVAVALMTAMRARGRSVAGLKPVASGSVRTPDGLRNDDALALQAAGTTRFDYGCINPYAFEPAVAPHLAAAMIGAEIDLTRLAAAFRWLAERAEHVVVEGAGGWRVPTGSSGYLSDLPRELDLAVVMVVGLRLGCINHAVLTAEAVVRSDGLRLIGWVGNTIEEDFQLLEENVGTLRQVIDAPCLGIVPRLRPADPARAAHSLDLEVIAS